MTTEEVCKEIKNDYPAFYEKMLDNKASNYRKFIKAVLFPVIHQFSWKSSSGNMWNVIMLARYRMRENVPVLSLTLNMKIGVWELFILKIYIVICL